jgi:hypothetical protein
MIKDLVQAVGPEFTAFLRPFERFFDNPGTVQHFRNYCAYRKHRRQAGFGGKSVRRRRGRLAGRSGGARRSPYGW